MLTGTIFGGLRPLACLAGVFLSTFSGCQFIETPPQKVATPLPISSKTPEAQAATQRFWTALHGNNYAALPAVIGGLEAADRAQPNDPTVTLLLGMSYAWLNFEQYRADAQRTDAVYRSQLTQLLTRATVLLLKAQRLAPNDRILPGFVAVGQFAEARAQKNAAGEEAAYQALLANTKDFPQFQGFIQGWVLTAEYPADHARFADGLEGYFATLDACVGSKVSRTDPSAPTFIFNVLAKADPACYNTDIAPHNLEGTFLGLGDAFAKQGKLPQARASYENAVRTPSYASWPYKSMLESRLAQLDQLQGKLAASTERSTAVPAMFFFAPYSCTACHAR